MLSSSKNFCLGNLQFTDLVWFVYCPGNSTCIDTPNCLLWPFRHCWGWPYRIQGSSQHLPSPPAWYGPVHGNIDHIIETCWSFLVQLTTQSINGFSKPGSQTHWQCNLEWKLCTSDVIQNVIVTITNCIQTVIVTITNWVAKPSEQFWTVCRRCSPWLTLIQHRYAYSSWFLTPLCTTTHFLHLASVLGSLLWTEEGENLVTSMRRVGCDCLPIPLLWYLQFDEQQQQGYTDACLWRGRTYLAMTKLDCHPST